MMASGLTLVSSCVGGAGELIINAKTGLSFEPGKSSDLARCLSKLAKDTKLQYSLARAGKDEVERKFSVKSAAQLLEERFRKKSSPGTREYF